MGVMYTVINNYWKTDQQIDTARKVITGFGRNKNIMHRERITLLDNPQTFQFRMSSLRGSKIWNERPEYPTNTFNTTLSRGATYVEYFWGQEVRGGGGGE